MSKKICRNCKNWEWDYKWDEGKGIGECKPADNRLDKTLYKRDINDGFPMQAEPGYGSVAIVRTRATFGCNQFEQKEI